MEYPRETPMEYRLESPVFGRNIHYLREKKKKSVLFFSAFLRIRPELLERIEAGELAVINPVIIYWSSKYFEIDEHTLMYVDLREKTGC